jgi:hypothetical protein
MQGIMVVVADKRTVLSPGKLWRAQRAADADQTSLGGQPDGSEQSTPAYWTWFIENPRRPRRI